MMNYEAMIDEQGIVRELLATASEGIYRRLDKTWIPLHPDNDDFDVSQWPVESCSEDFIERFDDAHRAGVTLDQLDLV